MTLFPLLANILSQFLNLADRYLKVRQLNEKLAQLQKANAYEKLKKAVVARRRAGRVARDGGLHDTGYRRDP